jgi:hypothetical protein
MKFAACLKNRYRVLGAVSVGILGALLCPASAGAANHAFPGATCRAWDLLAGPTDGVYVDANGVIRNGSSGNRVVICPLHTDNNAANLSPSTISASVWTTTSATCGLKAQSGVTVIGATQTGSPASMTVSVLGGLDIFWSGPFVYCTLAPNQGIYKITMTYTY